jgi:3-keto-5-aminohexanoate cleavage enzyme
VTAATMIAVAPTGAEVSKAEFPALPVTLQELVDTALACEGAGASVLHIHLRDGAAQPTLDVALARKALSLLRQETGLILQLSSGGAVSDSELDRLAILDAQPDSVSVTCGTVNFGDQVFANRWPFIAKLYQRILDLGIHPEFEIFDLGQISTLRRLLAEYGPPPGGHVHLDLVAGVPGGMPGSAAAIMACVHELDPKWTFSATGIGRTALPVMLASLALGGHVRVGMEDTLNVAKGEPVQSNRQLVERAALLAALAQRPVMAPVQARSLLGMGRGEPSSS